MNEHITLEQAFDEGIPIGVNSVIMLLDIRMRLRFAIMDCSLGSVRAISLACLDAENGSRVAVSVHTPDQLTKPEIMRMLNLLPNRPTPSNVALLGCVDSNPELAYRYVLYVRRNAGSSLEHVIASDPVYSYLYALNIRHGRFELGEPIMAENAEIAYMYAKHVLHDRFELGEPTILADSYYADKYKQAFFPSVLVEYTNRLKELEGRYKAKAI